MMFCLYSHLRNMGSSEKLENTNFNLQLAFLLMNQSSNCLVIPSEKFYIYFLKILILGKVHMNDIEYWIIDMNRHGLNTFLSILPLSLNNNYADIIMSKVP